MGTVLNFGKRKRGLSPISKGDCPLFRGFTFLEVILVIAMLAVLAGSSWLVLKGFWLGRSVETSAENLAALIRTAQVSAKETESAQKILLAREEAVWMRDEEIIRRQRFKNEVIIEELTLKGSSIEIPDEPIAEIGILIDERGNADSASIVLAKGEETAVVSAGGSIVTTGSLGILESIVVAQFIEQASSGEDVLIVQTEPLLARGWQVININNVDKVKEVKLRVKLDPKLPASAHLHAYVFPGWYENKPVAHGITNEQTMLDKENKMGTVPFTDWGQSPFSLYRESTNDCLAFFTNPSISGNVKKLNNDPIERVGLQVLNRNGTVIADTLTNNSGYYKFESLPTGYATLSIYAPSQDYNFSPVTVDITNIGDDAVIDFVGIRINGEGGASGYVRDKNTNQGIEGIRIFTIWVPDPFGIPDLPSTMLTDQNGFYYIPLSVDRYFSITPVSTGYIFEPVSFTLFADDFQTNINFFTTKILESSFGTNQLPLGAWNETEEVLKNNSLARMVPIWQEPKGYYIYKNEIKPFYPVIQYANSTQTLSIINSVVADMNITGGYIMYLLPKAINTLEPGGISDFPTKEAGEGDIGCWQDGYVYSSIAYQFPHTGESYEEVRQGDRTETLIIPISSLPPQTKFLRIAIAGYHKTSNGEQLLNSYPTVSSSNPNNVTISASQLDYPTDPFIIYHPWKNWINDPFWLSLYGYALNSVTPPLRPYGVNVLARRGPYEGENYKDGEGYKGFWYGPLYLDWDLILGKESLYWLASWVSSVFEMNSNRWRFYQDAPTWLENFRQDVDTYGNTALASPPHYWLKNFAYLSYWYLFQHSAYSEEPNYNLSLQDGSQPKRFQEPLNLGRTAVPAVNSWMKLFERADPVPYSAPWESSSLSVPFLDSPLYVYPMWLPSLPSMFGQQKIATSPDLYSSFYYLQERINHTMRDTGMWALFGNEATNAQKETAFLNIFPTSMQMHTNLSNFERYNFTGAETLSCWWEWYQNIPWAKGVAFPKKTGPLPTDMTQRIGWEKPVITQPSSYLNYFNSPVIFSNNPTNSYNATQVVNAPHTIFMSTAHYPLGSVQIVIKKK